MWQIKVFGKILGKKPFHGFGMFLENVFSCFWNSLFLQKNGTKLLLSSKRRRKMMQTKEEEKICKTRNNLFTSL
jgi:hypothetical protein